MRKLKPAIMMLACGAALACSDTDFAGSGGAGREEFPPVEETLQLTCDQDGGIAELDTEISARGTALVTMKGEFCQLTEEATTENLHVMFVLDFSGSMALNDPDLAGSCQRLAGAEAIVAKVKADYGENANVQLSVLPFADDALPAQGPYDLEEFETRLTSDVFCTDTGGSTNYEAAFAATKEHFDKDAEADGSKVVYFISDGLPTKAGTGGLSGIGNINNFNPGADPLAGVHDAGEKAAKELRDRFENLSLFAIFLGSNDDPNLVPLGTDGDVDPKTYLERITGAPEAVKLVENAEDLAEEIVEFETPEVASLSEQDADGRLLQAGRSVADIRLAELRPDPNREGVWIFSTESFEIGDDLEDGGVYEAEIEVVDSRGKRHKAIAKIRFEKR